MTKNHYREIGMPVRANVLKAQFSILSHFFLIKGFCSVIANTPLERPKQIKITQRCQTILEKPQAKRRHTKR